jgi:hypothetical protein
MSRTEERLQDALRASASRVKDDQLRPLPAFHPGPARRPSSARNRKRLRPAWRSWAGPAAAAASVVLVVGLVMAVTGGLRTGVGQGRATAPASAALCSAALTEGNDGTVSPLFCSDGSPNPAALAYYEGRNDRGFNPAVLRLAASSTEEQVRSAMCADVGPGGTMGLQTEQQAYDLAARRNGWNYDINTVTNLHCPPSG